MIGLTAVGFTVGWALPWAVGARCTGESVTACVGLRVGNALGEDVLVGNAEGECVLRVGCAEGLNEGRCVGNPDGECVGFVGTRVGSDDDVGLCDGMAVVGLCVGTSVA